MPVFFDILKKNDYFQIRYKKMYRTVGHDEKQIRKTKQI
jgi:hypothetical protein